MSRKVRDTSMLIDELNDSELDYYMMILHNLNSPHALAALKELASEEGVNFEKLLALARQSNQVLGSSEFGKSESSTPISPKTEPN